MTHLDDEPDPVVDINADAGESFGPLSEPQRLEADLLAIPGLVGTGLFLGMAVGFWELIKTVWR